MLVKPSFSAGGETRFDFAEELLGQEISPIPSLIVHGHLRGITGDRTAVASALLLGSAIAAKLVVGRPISHRVAAQIRTYSQLDGLDIPETTAVPLAVHTGSVELVVRTEGTVVAKLQHNDRRRMALQEIPTHRAAGRLFAFDSVVVATNSWLFGENHLIKNGNSRLEASLAVPVLMAQDLSASSITIPNELAACVDQQRLDSLKKLLLATDIQLKVGRLA